MGRRDWGASTLGGPCDPRRWDLTFAACASSMTEQAA